MENNEGQGTTGEQALNSIVEQALKGAGVNPQDIHLPTGEAPKVPSLDGKPKGEVKGSPLEVEEETSGMEEEKEPEAEKTEEAEKPEPPTKAEFEAIINAATAKFQSIMDRRISQVQTQLSQTIQALNQYFQTQDDATFAGLPADEQILRRLERLEKGRADVKLNESVSQQPAQFVRYLVGIVDSVGLKVDDNRIDWAPDTNDPEVGMSRFLTSIKKALTNDQTAALKQIKATGEKEILKLRKQMGIDKVSTKGPSGAGLPDISKLTPFEKIQLGFEQDRIAAQKV